MGLDVQLFEGQVPDDLLCTSCRKVLASPVKNVSCPHLFCNACLKRLIKTERVKACPACSAVLRLKGHTPSVELRLRLLDLVIRCSHNCGKVCKLGELPDHIAEECPHAPVTCPYAPNGCRMKVKRAQLGEHVEECDWRPVVCEACGLHTVYCQLFTHQSRTRCVEKKLRQQLVKAIRATNTDVKQHREYLDRQHIRLEQQQRQRMMEHYRLATAVASQSRHHHYNSHGSSNDSEEQDSPRVDSVYTVTTQSVTNPDVFSLTSAPQPVPDHDDVEMTIALNTPSPSRTGLHVHMCKNCKRHFRENNNSPNACRWHPGPIIELFGGTCYSCGRLDYQKGCMMGYHEA